MDFDAEAWKVETRAALIGWRDDFIAAARFLTRLPLAGFAASPSPDPARPLAVAMRAFPRPSRFSFRRMSVSFVWR